MSRRKYLFRFLIGCLAGAWIVLCARGVFLCWTHPELTNTQATRVVFFVDEWPE